MKPTCVTLESPLVVVKSQFFLNHNFSQINHSQISNSAESPNFIQYDYYSWWNSQLLAGLLPAIIYLSWVLDGWASIKPYEKHMKSIYEKRKTIWKAYVIHMSTIFWQMVIFKSTNCRRIIFRSFAWDTEISISAPLGGRATRATKGCCAACSVVARSLGLRTRSNFTRPGVGVENLTSFN